MMSTRRPTARSAAPTGPRSRRSGPGTPRRAASAGVDGGAGRRAASRHACSQSSADENGRDVCDVLEHLELARPERWTGAPTDAQYVRRTERHHTDLEPTSRCGREPEPPTAEPRGAVDEG